MKSINFQKVFNKHLYIISFIFLFFLCSTIMPLENKAKAYFPQNTNRIFNYSIDKENQDNQSRLDVIKKPYIQKENFLEINFEPLESEALSNIELELPDKEIYKVIKTSLEKRSQSNYTWRGKIYENNDPEQAFDVILTVVDGLMTGLIYTPKKSVYQIIPIGKGVHKIVLLDHNKFPGCSGPIIAPELDEETKNSQLSLLPNNSINFPQTYFPVGGDENSKNSETEIPVEDASSRIDVLVLYATDALKEAGGIAQARTHAQGSVDAANTAYANSKISTRLNLVGVEASTVLDNSDYNSILNFIRTDAKVAEMRNTTKADMVSIILSSISSASLCGLGFLNSSSNSAFSVVKFDCAIGNLTFAHELGHNMGCQHNPENGGSIMSGSFPFSFGHFQVNQFRTVMGTSSPNNPCGDCTRVPFFSNPEVSTQGLSTGVANKRDNARTINERASVLANFSQAETGKSVTLSVFPSTRFITQGDTASYTIVINRTDFDQAITA